MSKAWRVLLIVLAAAGVYGYIQVLQGEKDAAIAERDQARTELVAYKEQVRLQGEAAQKAAEVKRAADAKRKEQADAENARLRARNNALARSLRDARASRSYVPPNPDPAADPARACFDRAELERALQQLDEEVSGLVGEGDQAVADLDTAKGWVQLE